MSFIIVKLPYDSTTIHTYISIVLLFNLKDSQKTSQALTHTAFDNIKKTRRLLWIP